MDHRVKQLIHRNANQIRELSQRFSSYYSDDITVEKTIAFLLQFETYENIMFAFKLFSNINFLTSRKITYVIKSAFAKISDNDKLDPLIAPLGTSQDSSALVCYSLFKDIFEDESKILNCIIEVTQLEIELNNRNPSSIIFIDDNITSGTQLKDFFKELLEGGTNPELISNPLTPQNVKKIKEIPIYICYCIFSHH